MDNKDLYSLSNYANSVTKWSEAEYLTSTEVSRISLSHSFDHFLFNKAFQELGNADR